MYSKVLTAKEAEALNFIKENKFFFAAPFLNQHQYANWLNQDENKEPGTNLSKLLMRGITTSNNAPCIGEYNEALIGGTLTLDSCLLLGDDTNLINFFDKAPNFCQVILNIKKNDTYKNLIAKWNAEHKDEIQNMEDKIEKFNPILESLNEIKNQTNDLISGGFDEDGRKIQQGLFKIRRDLNVLSPLYNPNVKVNLEELSNKINEDVMDIMPVAKKHTSDTSAIKDLLQNVVFLLAAILDVISLTATTHLIPTHKLIIKTNTEDHVRDFKHRFLNFKNEINSSDDELFDGLKDENKEEPIRTELK